VYKWADFAPFVEKIVLAYDPGLEGTSGVQ
jgi:hypothetical protein